MVGEDVKVTLSLYGAKLGCEWLPMMRVTNPEIDNAFKLLQFVCFVRNGMLGSIQALQTL